MNIPEHRDDKFHQSCSFLDGTDLSFCFLNMLILGSDVDGWLNCVTVLSSISDATTILVEECFEVFEFGIGQDSGGRKSSLCIHVTNDFNWLDVSTVLLARHILGCNEITIQRHSELVLMMHLWFTS